MKKEKPAMFPFLALGLAAGLLWFLKKRPAALPGNLAPLHLYTITGRIVWPGLTYGDFYSGLQGLGFSGHGITLPSFPFRDISKDRLRVGKFSFDVYFAGEPELELPITARYADPNRGGMIVDGFTLETVVRSKWEAK